MQKSEAYYVSLLSGFIDNKLSLHEVNELLEFIQSQPSLYDRLLNSQEIKNKLSEQAYNNTINISEAVSLRMKEKLLAAVKDDEAGIGVSTGLQASYRQRKPLLRVLVNKWRWAAAAILVIAITTAVFMLVERKPGGTEPGIAKSTVNDVLPGGYRATLQLANGQVIILDSAANGSLAKQGNTSIIKLANGQIAYNLESNVTTEVMYNTMSTPAGGQFKLQLPDGTNVWLNAASSITYPTAFVGKDRTVSIKGEAYFEVAKDQSKPFHVKVNNMDVEVLGTHFNINSYADESAIKTTLLEGSVKVKSELQSAVILKPGEQALLAANSPLTIEHSPDIDQVMAWKNGLFNFNKLSLQEVMKQIARWYDVEVLYQGEVKPKKFGGEIQRDLNLSEVLEGLKETGIHFRIEEKKLIVLP